MSNSLSAVHPELVAEWSDRNLPLTPDSITFGSNKKVWWKGACGHEWETSVKARSNGEKCPICSGARVVTGINDLSTLKPELASEWSEKNKIKPTEVSIGSHKKVIWKCKLGHKWIATVKSRTINKTGCPYCSHNKVLVGFNDLATLFPEVADEWSDRNENSPTEVMAFANSKAWWKCRTCGYEWNTLISTRSGGSKCPCCSGYTFIKGKDYIHFYCAVRSILFKLTKGDAPDIEQMNARVRKMLEGAIQSDGIEELFETGKHISVDIFSDEYMDKINAIQLPNTKIKILQRLLSQAIDEFKKVNKIMGVEFADRLKKVVDEYNNRRRDEAYGVCLSGRCGTIFPPQEEHMHTSMLYSSFIISAALRFFNAEIYFLHPSRFLQCVIFLLLFRHDSKP